MNIRRVSPKGCNTCIFFERYFFVVMNPVGYCNVPTKYVPERKTAEIAVDELGNAKGIPDWCPLLKSKFIIGFPKEKKTNENVL